MKSLVKKLAIGLSALTVVCGFSLAPVAVHAQQGGSVYDGICKGVEGTGTNGCTDDTTDDNSFSGIARKVINIFSIVVGVVSVIMIIIGGFQYIISNGDSTKVTNAKNTILYAIVGLVIVLFAQVIVKFVLTNVKTK